MPHIVIDTNLWLDILVFDDPGTRALAELIENGAWTAIATDETRAELAAVIRRSRFALDQQRQDACMARFDALVRMQPVAAPAHLPCRDADDLKFLDLAAEHRCWLLSKDRAVLKLRRLAATRHGVSIGLPAAFHAAIGTGTADWTFADSCEHSTMIQHSRLPDTGTTIFTVMSQLAQQHGAINLGQGFPDFPCDPRLLDAVDDAMRAGHNQYAPMGGLPALRRQISTKIAEVHGHRFDPDTEITVTAGATQALMCAMLAFVQPGDEVLFFEPAYDCYIANIRMAGAIPVPIAMDEDYAIPWERVAAHCGPRTRAILVNTPHNPSGRCLHDSDRTALRELAEMHDLIVVSDEVYEHMVFDGRPHLSACGDPALAARSVVVSSFGKTLHVTGWKLGYVAAAAALTAEFRKIHQYVVFSVNTPAQAGIAQYLHEHPESWRALPDFYQARRDLFRDGLKDTRFRLLPCEGSYFQVVDYSAISSEPDHEFAKRLTRETGVAAIPMSAFISVAAEPGRSDPRMRTQVRFCFAKQESTLNEAIRRLHAL